MSDDHEEFQNRLIQYLKAGNFVIIPTEGHCDPIQRVSRSDIWMTKAAMAAAFGPLGALLSGSLPNANDSEVVRSLRSLYQLANLVGVRLKTGAVGIVLVIDADELEDEAIVGRCVLLQDKLSEFGKYGFKILNTPFGDIRQGVAAYVFFVFRQPFRADYFLNNLSSKCKQVAFFKKIYTLPWAIDVAGRKIHKWKGVPLYDPIGCESMRGHLFD